MQTKCTQKQAYVLILVLLLAGCSTGNRNSVSPSPNRTQDVHFAPVPGNEATDLPYGPAYFTFFYADDRPGVTYAFRFGVTPVTVETVTDDLTYPAHIDYFGPLQPSTTYFWQVEAYDENGVREAASPVWEFTTMGEDREVTFPDAGVTAMIRQAIPQTEGPLLLSGVNRIVSLAFGASVDLTGVEQLPLLKRLEFYNETVTSLELFYDHPTLAQLEFGSCAFSAFDQFSKLPNLRELNFSWYPGGLDLAELPDLPALTRFDVFYCEVTNWDHFPVMDQLAQLVMQGDSLTDVSFLSSLPTLRILNLTNNRVGSLAPLASCLDLHALFLESNEIVSLEPLRNLTHLKTMLLMSNRIADLTPLVENEALGEGVSLILYENPLSDEAIASQIPTLIARGVDVRY